MCIFRFGKKTPPVARPDTMSNHAMAELVLNSIRDGVIIVDKNGVIRLINPAGVAKTGCSGASSAVGLDYLLVLKLAGKDGAQLKEAENPVALAVRGSQPYESREFSLIQLNKGTQMPIYISVLPTGGILGDKIITFRDITAELEEESAQAEFISTASHEMRTPVASIEGYLALAVNPQTATIDERARKYLEEAQAASKHLGRLFQDLLDVTKMDDKRARAELVPIEVTDFVKSVAEQYRMMMEQKQINYIVGQAEVSGFQSRKLEQVVYCSVDTGFLREILTNLIENASKYTSAGGTVTVGVKGEGDRVIISVTDTGIGIAPDDAAHIFQKFYRVDSSQTQTIGGTGLGLYLVKQRTEAMGGRVWVESVLGQGSTFFVALPRITPEEYEKRRIEQENKERIQAFKQGAGGAPQQTEVQAPQVGVAGVAQAPQQEQQAPQASGNTTNQNQQSHV